MHLSKSVGSYSRESKPKCMQIIRNQSGGQRIAGYNVDRKESVLYMYDIISLKKVGEKVLS